MRSGVICVLLVLLIRKEGSGAAEDEFRPTPIPLNEWHEVRGWREQRAGTLHEALHATPAHYWEDALRHSVYLTLVRDKIDQLIAKGDFVDHPTNDLDDRDLWDKVKRAPFERTVDEEPVMVGDIVMMAKGKLMEENGHFRFTEDDKFKDKCAHNKCMDGVKALWSVKRIRQRNLEASGRYHYELTFSVITQKHHKKPYEKPARTFTVRESAPERIVETPQENRYYEATQAPVAIPEVAPIRMPVQLPREERVMWFHRNIYPKVRNEARQHSNGLDRLFSSLFSDDDEDDVPPIRYKPKQYYPPPPVYQQYSKAGYVGAPSEHQQKKLIPHKPPTTYKYNQYGRPIPQPPPHIHHHYLDIEQIGVVSAPYQDHRYQHIKPGKTPRPPVLPTPPNPVLPKKNYTIETTTPLKPNQSEETTQKPEQIHPPKTYNKHKPTTVKISYVTDHVRPPVYNAPPGVFVTMDKKPFKPMPPLRLVHSSKLHKTPRPTDFRPSPQVLDIQFSEPDPLFDTAFRPITVNYPNSNTTEKAVVSASDNHFRKSNSTVKKPPKKNEIAKAQRVTTTAPEIITAHSVEEDSDTEWTNVLGAFAKTTPMAAEKEKAKQPETTTPMTTTTVTTTTTTTPAPTTTIRKRTTTTTEAPSTTPKPTKRTRPPPKFKKPEKVKKHKRVTTTTTTTETPTTEHIHRKVQDLTPQASSVAATAKQSTSTSTSTTTTTTTTTQPTTTTQEATTTTSTTPQASTTTTAPTPTPTPDPESPKPKNRYRQSTLKYRSTSVKDKKEEKTRTVLPPTGIIPPRRKGSKYRNYITSTPKFSDMQFDDEGREDHVVSPYKSKSISTTESSTTPAASTSTTPAYEEVADHVYITSESPDYEMSQEDDFDDNFDERGEDKQESRDNSEILPSTSALVTPSETTNEIVEIEDEPLEITADVVSTTVSAPKNKTKCKKKKLQNVPNTTEETKPEVTEPATETKTTGLEVAGLETTSKPTTTTEPSSTPDIFEQIFGGFTFADSTTESKHNDTTIDSKLDEQETTNKEQYIKPEDDFADFFEAFEDKHRNEHRDGKYDDEYEYDDKEPLLDDEEFQFPNEEDRRASRDTKDEEETYDDYQERPYSLLELMAME